MIPLVQRRVVHPRPTPCHQGARLFSTRRLAELRCPDSTSGMVGISRLRIDMNRWQKLEYLHRMGTRAPEVMAEVLAASNRLCFGILRAEEHVRCLVP